MRKFNKYVGILVMNCKHFRLLILIILLLFQTGLTQAQNVLKGKVIMSSDSSPLPGANVFIKGTTSGTLTDFEGNFEIAVEKGKVIMVSFIGFQQKEFTYNGESTLTISLKEDVSELEEVVVVGYGVQQKKLLTGATGQVKGDKVAQLSTANVLDGMQGQTPGVTISASSGQPGESMKVNIRGVGTIGNADPLYIVDGVQTSDISYLNAADIESIDVLKDAASAAIYGSQAANGVILVSTKQGKSGKMNITFDTYYGIQRPAGSVGLLNSREYATIMNEAAVNSGGKPYFSQQEVNAMGEGTSWIDEMTYNNAVTQNYALGLSGGSEKSTYSMSLSYTGQEGIIGGPEVSDYQRYSLRINSDHKILDNYARIGENITFSNTTRKGVAVGNQYNNSLRGAFNTSPFLPMYDDNGDYLINKGNAGIMYQGQEWTPWYVGEANPYADMMYNNIGENTDAKLLGNVYLEISPIQNLKFTSRMGFDYTFNQNRHFSPEYELSIYSFRAVNSVSQGQSQGLAYTWDNFATYALDLNKHHFDFMAGMSAYSSTGKSMYASNSDVFFEDWDRVWLDNALNQEYSMLKLSGSPWDEAKLLSYYGRMNYNYDGKYMLNATVRADGSSRFEKGNQWGVFPSVSAGWVLSQENFMANTSSWLDFAKLRASWGQVGNQNITAWQYLSPINIKNGNYYFGSDWANSSGNAVGAFPERLRSENLRWEISEQTNIGLDAHFWGGKLMTTLDWYDKVTKDWLLEKPGYATDGADAPFFNGGSVRNRGIEIGVNWQDQIGEVKYAIGANVAKNENVVLEVPTEDGIVHGLNNMLYDNAGEFYHRARSGFPIGYFWGWETDGIFQNQSEIDAHVNSEGKRIQPNAQPGDVRYKDLNGDGIIDDDDKVMVGDPNPDYTFSFNFSVEYKGFDLSVLAYGVAGNQIVQSYRNHANAYANYTTEILDRWHGEGTSNSIPRVTETNVNYQFSDLMVKDGDFLRINNITIGYDLSRLLREGMFHKLRVYATVQNPFVFTKYNGMDPEVGYGLENGSAGVDLGFYPRPTTYMLGANINF
ncbi:TonB-dependent receptor [Persicobacter diffluens]|uniref:SusC/RagA family TonB-linked outer membrane protein n=1 Tax=Persicobacter diffluens TaxID=981 RepID=A0AAN4W4Y2_9BACT|nr:SusC/RagA family TonB-linked outer membrane protein [Persicobacter diffluens]